ncbi:chaplin [Streptomyces sp. NPDC058371]|uniref:chaplin n=1 Tax=Streptomyces sp. NPDC058371 TaxID=3346463 RepID=UPI00364A23C3
MRQTLSRGMVVAAAATGILSMYGTPAFADSQANGGAADSPGVGSGNNVQVPVGVPVNACGNSVAVVGALNPSFGNSCANGSSSHGSHGSHGAPHHSSHHGSGHHGGSGYGGSGYGDSGYGGYGGSSGHSGSSTHGGTHGSPGVGTGNDAQAPVDVPVNLCGDTVDVVGVGNPAFGNECGSGHPGHQGYGEETPPHHQPPHGPPHHHPHTPPHHPPHGTTPHSPPGTPPRTVPGTPPITRTVTPPSVPPTTRAMTPPGMPTEAGPSLAHTGGDDVLAAAAASAGLLISGTVLYRRGRAATRR